jgi:hypothetical protein
MGAFSDMVERAGNDFLASARATVGIVVEMVGEETVEATPMGKPETWKRAPPADYTPGAFKSNWRLSVDRVDDTFDPNRTSSFFVASAADLPATPFGHRFVFSNAAPYAWRIEEDQWSNQAPGGVVGPVALEFNRIVAAASAKAQTRAGGPREL